MSKCIIHIPDVFLGADPEVFLEDSKGNIVPSEKVIPKGGLLGISRDGIQAEFKPEPSRCRQSFATSLFRCMYPLHPAAPLTMKGLDGKTDEPCHILLDGKPIGISPRSIIKMSREDLMQLSVESQILGCNPSKNIYDSNAEVDDSGPLYGIRSCGGHMHFGIKNHADVENVDPARIIQQLDIWVGNTCVMIDRDPMMPLRRQLYGRAGEWRPQPHGLEYRTLSNFWIKSPRLVGLVFGLARIALGIVNTVNGVEAMVLNVLDPQSVRKAIDTNDYMLAMSNFKKLIPIMLELQFSSTRPQCALAAPSTNQISEVEVNRFLHFLSKPLDYWFPKSWYHYWTGPCPGFESFLSLTVAMDMEKGAINGSVGTERVAGEAEHRARPAAAAAAF